MGKGDGQETVPIRLVQWTPRRLVVDRRLRFPSDSNLAKPITFMSRATMPSDVDPVAPVAPQLPPDRANAIDAEVLLEGPPDVSRCNSVPDIGDDQVADDRRPAASSVYVSPVVSRMAGRLVTAS
jgi:hypothetical protein